MAAEGGYHGRGDPSSPAWTLWRGHKAVLGRFIAAGLERTNNGTGGRALERTWGGRVGVGRIGIATQMVRIAGYVLITSVVSETRR